MKSRWKSVRLRSRQLCLRSRQLCLRTLLLLAVASILAACDERVAYHSFRPLPTEGWLRQDTLCFSVAVADSQAGYRLYVETRNRSDYPYRNLDLYICCLDSGMRPLLADSVRLMLADPKGAWKGKGWGGLYQYSFAVESLRMEKAGTYLFKLAHTLPDERLAGMNDIGIKLERDDTARPHALQPPVAPRVDAEEDEQQDGETPK